MNKKIVYSAILVCLFCSAGFVSAADSVTISNPLSGVNNFTDLLVKIADGAGTLIGILGTIMLIVAGILYLTSAGSPEKLGTAKKALIYAIAGMVIGAAAKAIVSVIMNVLK
jgi:riboflavin transporter FmnP